MASLQTATVLTCFIILRHYADAQTPAIDPSTTTQDSASKDSVQMNRAYIVIAVAGLFVAILTTVAVCVSFWMWQNRRETNKRVTRTRYIAPRMRDGSPAMTDMFLANSATVTSGSAHTMVTVSNRTNDTVITGTSHGVRRCRRRDQPRSDKQRGPRELKIPKLHGLRELKLALSRKSKNESSERLEGAEETTFTMTNEVAYVNANTERIISIDEEEPNTKLSNELVEDPPEIEPSNGLDEEQSKTELSNELEELADETESYEMEYEQEKFEDHVGYHY